MSPGHGTLIDLFPQAILAQCVHERASILFMKYLNPIAGVTLYPIFRVYVNTFFT